MIFQIGNKAVDFQILDRNIRACVDKEYNLLPRTVKNSSLKVEIDTYIPKLNKPQQILEATGRKSRIEYWDENQLHVSIPRNTIEGRMFRLINPSFQSKQEAALTDFLHNLFLGILQVHLLSQRNTLFHASSICLPNQGKAIVFFGDAQSGKSTLAGLLTQNGWGKIISEDFGIVSEEGKIYALPHKSRVHIDQYDRLIQKREAGDRLNRVICKLIHKEPIRILPFAQIYHTQKFAPEMDIEKIYFLKRDGDHVFEEECSREVFAQECMKVLKSEFENFTGFREMFGMFPKGKYMGMDFSDVLAATEQELRSIYSKIDCKLLHVPFGKTAEVAAEQLREYLMGR